MQESEQFQLSSEDFNEGETETDVASPSARTQEIYPLRTQEIYPLKDEPGWDWDIVFRACSREDMTTLITFWHDLARVTSFAEKERVVKKLLSFGIDESFLGQMLEQFLSGNHPRSKKIRAEIKQVHRKLFPSSCPPIVMAAEVARGVYMRRAQLSHQMTNLVAEVAKSYLKEFSDDTAELKEKIAPEFKEQFIEKINRWIEKRIVRTLSVEEVRQKLEAVSVETLMADKESRMKGTAGLFIDVHNIKLARMETKEERRHIFFHETFHLISAGPDARGMITWLDEAITESLATALMYAEKGDVSAETLLTARVAHRGEVYGWYRTIMRNLLDGLKIQKKQVKTNEKIPIEQLLLNVYFETDPEKQNKNAARFTGEVGKLVGNKEFFKKLSVLVKWCDPAQPERNGFKVIFMDSEEIFIRNEAVAELLERRDWETLLWLFEICDAYTRCSDQNEAKIKITKLLAGKRIHSAEDIRNSYIFEY